MSLKYFGTDGIRGKFNGPVLNTDLARRLGYALARFLMDRTPGKSITVAIGRDTRQSGNAISEALAEGFCSHGVHLIRLGVIPTPGVALNVAQLNADLGIAITASHNPACDNGIKLFDRCGNKLLPSVEAEIEALLELVDPASPPCSTCGYDHDAEDHYVNYLRSLLHHDCLRGWRIAVDCANGATYRTSPLVLQHFGAEVIAIGTHPNGDNINAGVGSEFPDKLAGVVSANHARLGIAHDGDGDRVILCDETGSIVHGDQLLGILAIHAISVGKLNGNTLVTTVQSNLGLDRCLNRHGGHVIRTDVGDRNVLHTMLNGDYSLGGEQSGHIICRDALLAGDGLIAALKVVEIMLATGKPLSNLRQLIQLYPQKTVNLQVCEKPPLKECRHIQEAMQAIETEMGNNGRILVRYSGTEPKLRLLVEACTSDLIDTAMDRLKAAAVADLPLQIPV